MTSASLNSCTSRRCLRSVFGRLRSLFISQLGYQLPWQILLEIFLRSSIPMPGNHLKLCHKPLPSMPGKQLKLCTSHFLHFRESISNYATNHILQCRKSISNYATNHFLPTIIPLLPPTLYNLRQWKLHSVNHKQKYIYFGPGWGHPVVFKV